MTTEDGYASSDPTTWRSFVIEGSQAGIRLDAFLAQELAPITRSQVQAGIEQQAVFVNRSQVKASYRLRAGDCVEVRPWKPPPGAPLPEELPLDLLYEDDHLVVVNKPAGMVVHPAKGHWRGTLASALAHRFGVLSGRGGLHRPGIVHRLDRDTSGVIVVARSDQAHADLTAQFTHRTVKKIYLAILRGELDRDADVIEQPIGVHPYHRERMAIRASHSTSRPAVTTYRVLERLAGYCLVEIEPRTGRTHQIRVHMAHAGCPVVADRLYAGHSRLTGKDVGLNTNDLLIARQALHASRLTIRHPATAVEMTFEAPLPADMEQLLRALRARAPRQASPGRGS